MGYAGSQFHRGPNWRQDPLSDFAMSVEDLQRQRGGNAIFGQESGSPYQVDTIADLKALDVLLAFDGVAVIALGYYAAGDGGGGNFTYDNASSAADNGGTVIAPDAGSGRWRRTFNGALSVQTFGAKHDGTTDDSDAINAALTAASDLSADSKFVLVTFGPYKYYIGDGNPALTIPQSVAVDGFGANFIYGGTGVAVLSHLYEAYAQRFIITQQTAYSPANPVSALTGTGFKVDTGAWSHVTGVEVDGFNVAFDVVDCTELDFYSCVASDYEIGAYIRTSASGKSCTAIRFFGGALTCQAFSSMAGSRGIKINNVSGGTVDGIVFHGVTNEGNVERKLYLNNANHCSFQDLYWDATNGGTDIELTSSSLNNRISGGSALSQMVIADAGVGNFVENPGVGSTLNAADPFLKLQSTAGHYAIHRFFDGATEMYQIYKAADNTFALLRDIANSRTVLIYDPVANTLTAAGSVIMSNSLKVVGDVGFYNTAPVSKPIVTGSRGANDALTSLLTALAAQGLIVNSSS